MAQTEIRGAQIKDTDITVSDIANDAVSNAKLANMATSTLKGRVSAGTGDPEDLTVAQAKTLLNLSGTNTGDVAFGASNPSNSSTAPATGSANTASRSDHIHKLDLMTSTLDISGGFTDPQQAQFTIDVSFPTSGIPSAPGTASQGSATKPSRSDHVHPAQTTISGNAASATKLATARTIAGISFDGSANIAIPSTGLSDITGMAGFIPELIGTTGSKGAASITAAGKYYAIGQLVFVQIYLNWTSMGSWTGNMRITGLPFVAVNSGYNLPLVVSFNNITLLAAGNKVQAVVVYNTDYINLLEIGSGAQSSLPVDQSGTLLISGCYLGVIP